MPLPFPQRIFSRVTDITPALLAGLGVRGILLDIDGTPRFRPRRCGIGWTH